MKSKVLALFLLCVAVGARAQCSPFQGLGAVQFFDNGGVPLTNGVLYSFQAGTSTQQATFTDSTCTTQNVNPITFTTGARVNIWLTTGSFYKFQLCLQNDGSTCAPSDVLFSVDQVPGGASGSGGGGGPPFTSGSANPATSGILRCASGDQCVVFRNTANSGNLAITKDSNDVLTFPFAAMKLGETSCSLSSTGFDYWCADSSTHHWKWTGNGSAQFFSPGLASSGTSGNVVTLTSNGIDIQDSGHSETYLNFEMALVGPTNFASNGAAGTTCLPSPSSTNFCIYYTFTNAHTVARLNVMVQGAETGCTTHSVLGIKDITSSTVLLSMQPTSSGLTTVTGSVSMPAGDLIGVGVLTQSTGCAVGAGIASISAIYQ